MHVRCTSSTHNSKTPLGGGGGGGGPMVLTLRNSCRGPGCATKILTLFQTIQHPYLVVAF